MSTPLPTPTLDEYMDIPASQRPSTNRVVVQAIKNLLQSVPLQPHPVQDSQPHTDPTEKHGTIVLPLWEQNATLNSSSPHWQAINTFLDTLAIVGASAEILLRAASPEKFRQAMILATIRRLQTPQARQIRARTQNGCFESVRINVNLALGLHFPSTFHPSETVGAMILGNYTGGECCTFGMALGIQPGGFQMFNAGIPISIAQFQGERYQVEFFLPDLS